MTAARSGGGQRDGDGGSRANARSNRERPAVPLDDMLDDGEAEPGAAAVAATRGVDAVEALGQARQVLRRDSLAAVGDGELDMAESFAGQRHDDFLAGPRAAIAKRV